MKRLKFFLPVWVLFITISCLSINTLTPKEAPASQIPVSTQTIPPTISPTNTLVDSTPTVTATVAQIPILTGTSTICPPENFLFPAPEDLENYIGLQYINNPSVDYPREEYGELVTIDGREYGFESYKLNDDQSHMLVFVKTLCHDSTSYQPAREIIDVVRTQRQVQAYVINCTNKTDGSFPEIPIVCLLGLNNGDILAAWTIDPIAKKIIDIPTDGLLEVDASG